MDMPMECLICDLKLPNYAALKKHLSEHIITSATESVDNVDNNNDEIPKSCGNTESVSRIEIGRDNMLTSSESMVYHNDSEKLLLATPSEIGCLSRTCINTAEDCTSSPSTLDLPMTNSSYLSIQPIYEMVPSINDTLTDECINDVLTKLLRANTTTTNSQVRMSIPHIDEFIPSNKECNNDAFKKLLPVTSTSSDIICVTKSCSNTAEDCTTSSSNFDVLMVPMSNSSCARISVPPIDEMVPPYNALLTDECNNDTKGKTSLDKRSEIVQEQYHKNHCSSYNSDNTDHDIKLLSYMDLSSLCFVNMGAKLTLEQLKLTAKVRKEEEEKCRDLKQIATRSTFPQLKKKEITQYDFERSDDVKESFCNKIAQSKYYDCQNERKTSKAEKLKRAISMSDPERFEKIEHSSCVQEDLEGKKFEVEEKIKSFPIKNCASMFMSASELDNHTIIQDENSFLRPSAEKKSIGSNDFEDSDSGSSDSSITNFKDSDSDIGRNSDSSITDIYSDDEYYPIKKSRVKKYAKKLEKGTSFHICQKCNKYFANSSALKIHYRTHSGEKPYQCQVCSRKFSQNNNLTVHLRTHAGNQSNSAIKNKVCHQCNKGFSTNQDLRRHQSVHTGEKPYQCLLCKRRFAQNSNLTVHLQTHMAKVKPFSCDQCDVKYTRRAVLVAHKKFVHNKELNFQCKKCHTFFAHNSTLKNHMLIHTSSRPLLYCEDCPKAFTTKSNLNVHYKKCHKK